MVDDSVPAVLDALQTYSPLSDVCMGEITRLPLDVCWTRRSSGLGSWAELKNHVTTGCGSPVAAQPRTAMSPTWAITVGVVTMITGTTASKHTS